MTTGFLKFPHTPHLAWLGTDRPREDKILSDEECTAFLKGEIVVEEKVDGANVGFSVGPNGRIRVQNRGAYLGPGAHPQFEPLWGWLASRECSLVEALGEHLMLFGEWCFAVHSVRYDRLPDWFLAIDVYDRRGERFWSSPRRDALLRTLSIAPVPCLDRGRFDLDRLQALTASAGSAVGTGSVEGLYLRREDQDQLLGRAKLVRPEFGKGIDEHWSKCEIKRNRLAAETVITVGAREGHRNGPGTA